MAKDGFDEKGEVSNVQRAERAWAALKSRAGMEPEPGMVEDRDEVVSLLADLRHFCQQNGVDFDECQRASKKWFEMELKGERAPRQPKRRNRR